MTSLILTGCSSNQAATKTVSPTKKSAQTAPTEQKKKIEVVELLGKTLESAPKEWGNPISTDTDLEAEGATTAFRDLKDVTFAVSDDKIDYIIIKNKDVDVYGSSVGQTPAEVKKALGNPVTEELGKKDYFLEYEFTATILSSAYYFSSDKDSPVTSISLFTKRPPDAQPDSQQSSVEINVQARFVGTSNLGIIIEVINAGTTPVKNVVVETMGQGYDSMGKKATPFNQGNVSYLAQGESKQIEIMTNYGGIKVTNATVRKVSATPSQ